MFIELSKKQQKQRKGGGGGFDAEHSVNRVLGHPSVWCSNTGGTKMMPSWSRVTRHSKDEFSSDSEKILLEI